MNQVLEKTPAVQRDYTIFDADISGAVLNMQLLRRLLRWLAPYKLQLMLSTSESVVVGERKQVTPRVEQVKQTVPYQEQSG